MVTEVPEGREVEWVGVTRSVKDYESWNLVGSVGRRDKDVDPDNSLQTLLRKNTRA